MKSIRIIFALAAAWGLFALLPGLFGEAGPRPEYYYGFIGIALVFQLIFLLLPIDPVPYRALIPLSILEKLSFFLPVTILYAQGRVDTGPVFFGAMVDGLFMLLFALAWLLSRRADKAA